MQFMGENVLGFILETYLEGAQKYRKRKLASMVGFATVV